MRESIDLYFLKMAKLVGTRSTCNRGYTGCIIVKNKQIISTGYSGSPSGLQHCDEVGHEIENNHCIRTTHSEQNAIVNAAKNGISTNETILYCTMFPCYICSKMIINAGIKKVFAEYDYHSSKKSKQIFNQAGIKYKIINNKIKQYEEK